MTPIQQIGLAVTFAQQDLSLLEQEDWEKLKSDFGRFFEGPVKTGERGIVAVLPGTYPEDENDFEAVRVATRRLLDEFIHHRDDIRRWLDGAQSTEPSASVKAKVTLLSKSFNGGTGACLLIQADAVDAFILKLGLRITAGPSGKLTTCPECSKLFFKAQGRKYCESKCAQRVSTRKWRSTKGGQLQRAAQAKRRYDRGKEKNSRRSKGLKGS